MNLSIKDVEGLAELAKIELSEEEKKSLLKDMEEILGYVKEIGEMKTLDEKEEYKIYNVSREDELLPREFSREIMTGQFPDSQDGFLKVKKIL